MKKTILDLQDRSEQYMLFQLSWPVVVSLLIQGLYSFVDSIFLSRLGAEVLSAVSLSFVVQGLATAFFTGIATGMNAVISRSLGAGDYRSGKIAVKAGFLIQGFFVVVFMLFGLFGSRFYFVSTTDNAAIIEYGVAYFRPLMVLCVAMALQITAERLLQATGLTRYMLYSQIAGTLVNVVLDPIMIFGLCGCPKMGIVGAAYATVLGQIVAALVALYFNKKCNTLVFSDLNQVPVQWDVAKTVMKIGIPTAATGICSSFGNYFINRILVSFSANANAAFGIYAKLQSIALMPTQGMHAGLVTMYAFFYGKRDMKKIDRSIKCGEMMVGGWNFLCFLTFFTLPGVLMKPFSPTPEMLEVAYPCFRIIGTTYLTSGLMSGLTSLFQASGHSQYTLFVGICRTVIVRVPVAYALKTLNDVNLIWWCWPISELPSDLTCFILFLICYRQVKRELLQDVPSSDNEQGGKNVFHKTRT